MRPGPHVQKYFIYNFHTCVLFGAMKNCVKPNSRTTRTVTDLIHVDVFLLMTHDTYCHCLLFHSHQSSDLHFIVLPYIMNMRLSRASNKQRAPEAT